MKNQILLLKVLVFLIFCQPLIGQVAEQESNTQKTTKLFRESSPLTVAFSYSNKEMIKNTNDSTFLKTNLSFMDEKGVWDSLEVRLRARGNWRQKNCFLTPVKMEIKKDQRKKNVFKGNKELKLVMPCENSERGQDYIIKEYLAYKLYETITPFHFKSRMLQISYSDIKKRNEKAYEFVGFVIEDISEVTKRNDGAKFKKTVHPLNHDGLASVQNDFFQYLIGNTDFSSTYQHNEKLMFVKGRNAIPVPYDFDMSGLVDAEYAVVSQIQGQGLGITDVRQRLYRGFKRELALFEEVRQQYISKKDEFMAILEEMKPLFKSEKAFENTHSYLVEFFEILEDDSKFKAEIVDKARDI